MFLTYSDLQNMIVIFLAEGWFVSASQSSVYIAVDSLYWQHRA